MTVNNDLYEMIFKRKSFHIFRNLGDEVISSQEIENVKETYKTHEILRKQQWKDKRMGRIIRSADGKDLINSLELVETVFTESEGEESGKSVRSLVEEIRSKKYYLPELDLVMADEENAVIGYAMFSRFHLDGKYENQLLLLSPVAVKTNLQRQHISKN